mgnify:CR=1 FL=1
MVLVALDSVNAFKVLGTVHPDHDQAYPCYLVNKPTGVCSEGAEMHDNHPIKGKFARAGGRALHQTGDTVLVPLLRVRRHVYPSSVAV